MFKLGSRGNPKASRAWKGEVASDAPFAPAGSLASRLFGVIAYCEVAHLEFFKLLTREDAIERYVGLLKPRQLETERVALVEAVGRVLAEPLVADINVPESSRSTVDGYALKASDTFGATEAVPALFEIVGEVAIGHEPTVALGAGQACRVSTGSLLPPGADACVMVEHTEELGGDMLACGSDVSPGENVILPGEDLSAGDVVLSAGHRLRPQDIGIAAACGITFLNVYTRLKVHVVSTGNEIVPPGKRPAAGEIRDINGPALCASLKSMGCDVGRLSTVRDDYDLLYNECRNAMERGADVVFLSGGSSVGAHDLTPQVISALGAPGVVVHGLAIKPGKPTILGLVGDVAVFGLPGHPASALVVFEVVAAPLIQMLAGSGKPQPGRLSTVHSVQAVLRRSLASVPGREDFVRARLVSENGTVYAEPQLGKSGLISTMVKADGLIHIPLESGGVEKGSTVNVIQWRQPV